MDIHIICSNNTKLMFAVIKIQIKQLIKQIIMIIEIYKIILIVD